MGKIIGENFAPFVDKQIKVRQEKLGSTTYDNELISYTTSKDSWLRLTSGVNIDQTRLNNLPGTPIGKGGIPEGSGLAERYVLFGGANNTTTSSKPKGGIVDNYTDSILKNASYGFDSTANYGLTPLPGVTSFNIKPKNNGSLIEGEIKIKCYNVQQFNHIEALYLRLGYTLLLEWGHTIYFKNDKSLESDVTSGNQVYKEFLQAKSGNDEDPQTYIQNKIKQTRSDSSGNYDGMLGRVLNYNWEVTPEGEYNITVKVLSPGDIIESLSISTNLPGDKRSEPDSPSSGIENKIESTTIGRILGDFKKRLDGVSIFSSDDSPLGELKTENLGVYSGIVVPTPRKASYFNSNLTNDSIKLSANLEDLNPYKDEIISPPSSQPLKELIKLEGENSDEAFYYIKFGALLRIIQNFLLLYNTTENSTPIIGINWEYDENQCFIPLEDLFSSDPRTCLIPSRFKTGVVEFSLEGSDELGFENTFDFKKINQILGSDFLTSKDKKNDKFTYNFMHIHLNIDLIFNILDKNINSAGNLALIDFLLALCTQINSSLSNATELTPFHDTDDNILYIVNKRNSNNILPDSEKEASKFQIGFYNSGQGNITGIQKGSFVKNISINSTIPPNFATQIAIGAQANNTSVDQNSFSFSNWNRGYTDRIVLDKKTSAESTTAKEEQIRQDRRLKYAETVKSTEIAVMLNSTFSYSANLYKLSTAINKYFEIRSSENIKKDNSLTSPVLIPISLSLTMDGLSGMKIFQKYTITDEFLPQSYRDNIEFIIKGINHTIDGSGWITNVEGQFMPKARLSEPITEDNPLFTGPQNQF